MTAYRFARPEEEDQILDLIDLVFSKADQPHDFASLLPKVYGHAGFSRMHAVAVDDGRVTGTIGMLPMTVWMGDQALRGGYIGSVAVHSRCRGRGHMNALMALLIGEARERGYDFLALSGQRQRYGHWGFEVCGENLRFSINQRNANHALQAETARFSFAPPADGTQWAAVKSLHDSLPFHCERSESLFREIVKSYGGELLAILNEAGGMEGYLIRTEGEITEIGLSEEARLPAVIKCLLNSERRILVNVPGSLPGRARTLHGFAESAEITDKEMLLPLRWENLLRAGMRLREKLEKAQDGGRNLLPDGERIIRIEEEGAFLLKVENGKTMVSPSSGAPDEVFGRRQAVDSLFSAVGARLLRDPLLRAWLPLPWGLNTSDTF